MLFHSFDIFSLFHAAGAQVRLVKIWTEKSASAIQAFHTAFGVGAMVAPFVAAPFLGLRENNLTIKVSV